MVLWNVLPKVILIVVRLFPHPPFSIRSIREVEWFTSVVIWPRSSVVYLVVSFPI